MEETKKNKVLIDLSDVLTSVCVRTHLVDVHQKNVRKLQIYS